MLPIYWRYILTPFLKTYFLSVVSFIVLILVARLKGIAGIAALGASWKTVGLYTLYQIPYILPFAIICSSILGGFLVFQRLSVSHELTALRASGLPFRAIAFPVLLVSFIFGCLNFFIVSELTTQSKIRSVAMKYELAKINPLTIFQKHHLLKGYGIVGDLKVVDLGKRAEDVVFAYYSQKKKRISLLLADQLVQSNNALKGDALTFIQSAPAKKQPGFDQLIIENHKEVLTPYELFSWFFRAYQYSPKDHYLRLPLLLIKLEKAMDQYNKLIEEKAPASTVAAQKRKIKEPISEIFRRFSLALSTITFTLMGMVFGTSISRKKSLKGIAISSGLAFVSVSSFFFAKGWHANLAYSSLAYFGPHLIIIVVATWVLSRLTRGYT